MNRQEVLERLWSLLPRNKEGVTLEAGREKCTLLVRDGLECDIGPVSVRAHGFILTGRQLVILTDKFSVPLDFLEEADMQVGHEG